MTRRTIKIKQRLFDCRTLTGLYNGNNFLRDVGTGFLYLM